MLIRILEIPPEGRELSEAIAAEWVDVALGDAGRGAVGLKGALEARVELVGDNILIQGHAQVPVQLACARCLTTFSADLEFDITHILEPKVDDDSEEEMELDGGDLDVSYIEGPEFDMSDVLREHIHLALPMNALCRGDCAGLCDQCGGNLNEGKCGCQAPVDPRWAGLAKIKLN